MNKSQKTQRRSILHDFVVVPITDPAEQVALERRIRKAEQVLAARAKSAAKAKARKGK